MTFKQYHLTLGNSSSSYTLVYELEQHTPAQEWAKMMKSTVIDPARQNPWVESEYFEKRLTTANRLNELIQLLNQWIPNKIEAVWDVNDFQNSLNKLHIHFPELEKSEKDPVRLSQLSEYNDIIHLLEHLYRNGSANRLMLVISPKINEVVNINDEDFLLFNPSVKFGEMVLHYPLVGRNAFELLQAKDYTCPIEQIKPQNIITPFHHLRFFNDPTDAGTYREQFKHFYSQSTIKEKYSIDDPKIAFGFIKLGKLVTSLGREQILKIVRSYNTIDSWKIV